MTASALGAPRPSTVILECPECGELGESDAREISLVCPECAYEWDKEPARSADETIACVRKLLTEQQDATRRAFYSSASLLRAIATAIDAYPDPPLQPKPVYRILKSWRSIVADGFPVTACGWHLDARSCAVWSGSLAEAVAIVREQYPSSRGIDAEHGGVDAEIVLANAEEILSC